MKRRTFLASLGAVSASTAFITVNNAANNETSNKTNGTNRTFNSPYDPVDLNAGPYRTNDQLTQSLAQLEATSERLKLRRIARSAGREAPIWEVKIGHGDTNVHLITQIHGDEPAGTEAALLVLRHLSDGDTELVHKILNNITLTVIPRVNPDGAMFRANVDDDEHQERISRRYNTQEWRPTDSYHEPYYHYTPPRRPPGYDLNRDFNIRTDFVPEVDGKPDWWVKRKEEGNVNWYMNMPYEGYELFDTGLLLTPEVNAVTRSFLKADPDYAITHHHQGIPIDPESSTKKNPEPSLLSLMPVLSPAYKNRSPFYNSEKQLSKYLNPFISKQASTRSLRLNKLVAEALAETTGPWDAFETVTRYGYSTIWGSYLDALCPQTDAAGMLYEVSSQSSDVGSRAYGLKVEASRVGFLRSFSALAEDPSLSDINAASFFDIPLKGDAIENWESKNESLTE
jgi:hypothetical protein